MNNNNQQQEKEEMIIIIEFIDEKIKLYEAFRSILYQNIDTVHNSPDNLTIFTTLHEISIRLNELFQLKTRLTSYT